MNSEKWSTSSWKLGVNDPTVFPVTWLTLIPNLFIFLSFLLVKGLSQHHAPCHFIPIGIFNIENKNNFYIFSKFNQIKIILSTFYKKQYLSPINKSE